MRWPGAAGDPRWSALWVEKCRWRRAFLPFAVPEFAALARIIQRKERESGCDSRNSISKGCSIQAEAGPPRQQGAAPALGKRPEFLATLEKAASSALVVTACGGLTQLLWVEGHSATFSQRRTAVPLLYLCRASSIRFHLGSNRHIACGLVGCRFLAETGHPRELDNWPSGRMLAQRR